MIRLPTIWTSAGGMELFNFAFEQEARRDMGLPVYQMIYMPNKLPRILKSTFKRIGHYTDQQYKLIRQ